MYALSRSRRPGRRNVGRPCCSPRAIHKQQPLCLLDRFSSVCVRHILVSVRCSLFDQHVSRRLPEHLPSVLQTSSGNTGPRGMRSMFVNEITRWTHGRARATLRRWRLRTGPRNVAITTLGRKRAISGRGLSSSARTRQAGRPTEEERGDHAASRTEGAPPS